MDEKNVIYYQNCRGLRTKLNTLFANILTECYDVIILSETWLIPNITDSEIMDSRYLVFRCDRNRDATGKCDGGGVLVAVRRGLRAERAQLTTEYIDDSDGESLPALIDYVLLRFNIRGKHHLICGLYIPPNQPFSIYSSFLNALRYELDDNNLDLFYITGDFNIPFIDWERGHSGSYSALFIDSNYLLTKYIFDFLQSTNSKQQNYIKNNKGRVLDLFISNVESCTCEPPPNPLVPVDCIHPPFCILTSFNFEHIMCTRSKLSFRFLEGKYSEINEHIRSINWDDVLNHNSIELSVSVFYEKLYEIISCTYHYDLLNRISIQTGSHGRSFMCLGIKKRRGFDGRSMGHRLTMRNFHCLGIDLNYFLKSVSIATLTQLRKDLRWM